MQIAIRVFLGVLLFRQIGQAQSTKPATIPVTYYASAPESLIDRPLEEIAEAETVSIRGMVETHRHLVLARMQQLPKLTELELRHCDLSKIDEADPVPVNVKSVSIVGGKISQGTIRWLAKFPKGRALLLANDLTGLKLNLGNFKWITLDDCKVPRSEVIRLVEQMTQVVFTDVVLVDDK